MGDLVIVFVCAVVAFLFIFFCWKLPIWLTSRITIDDPKELAQLQDSIRKTIAQIAGGAALVLAFSWTFLKDRQTLEISKTQMVNQQFAEAAKHLAIISDPKTSSDGRAAGIYVMENIVISRGEYYAPVFNTLLALVQSQQRQMGYPEGTRPPSIPNDMKAALYVIAKFPRQKGNTLDFRGFHLTGADFSSSRALDGINFRGAKLFVTNFTGASLIGATFDGADMSDYDAYGNINKPGGFSWELAQSKPWKEYERFHYMTFFDNADLTNAIFRDIYVNGVSFRGANLHNTDFRGVNLSRADFTGAKNLDKAHFDGACYHELFKPEGLSDALLKKANVKPGCR